MATAHEAGASLAISIRGPAGVIDLAVPAGASVADLAREYAAQGRLPYVAGLRTAAGRELPGHQSLREAGLTTGAFLVVDAAADSRPWRARQAGRREGPGASPLWFVLAASAAVAAGCFGSSAEGALRWTVVGLLTATAVLAVLPVGRDRVRRGLTAPAFGAAATLVLVWDPHPERLPLVLGIVGLGAAIVAAAARSLGSGSEQGLRVWIATGAAFFLLASGVALASFPQQAFWASLLLVALFAPRFVPSLVVDVPDQFLIDLDRLAVNAWSARETPGRRPRTVVPRDAVAQVASKAGEAVTAAAVAVLVVCVLGSVLLLSTVDIGLDLQGARVFVALTGGGVLLAARTYRHRVARGVLRTAGLACWVVLVADLVPGAGERTAYAVLAAAVLLAVVLVLAAVATGRGWRSAWWSRRAEVAEALCGAFGLGAFVVAVGLFRVVWESVNIG